MKCDFCGEETKGNTLIYSKHYCQKCRELVNYVKNKELDKLKVLFEICRIKLELEEKEV